MTTALEAFQEALVGGADDDALDIAAADVRRDSGAAALVEAIKMRIAYELGRGKSDLDVTALRFRLAGALEETARTSPGVDGAKASLEAAALCREVLNDGEGTTRNLIVAFRSGANDDQTLKRAVEVAGGREAAEHIVEKTLKKPEVKEDAATTALLRRALARIAESAGDKERAFFEMLKCARKQPSEGLYVDEVFRLSLDTGRHTEAAAFFGALGDDAALPERHRATIYNKLGQTHEKLGDKRAALEAYTKSLRFHEAKSAKRSAERLAQELGVEVESPIRADEPVDVTPPYDHKSGTITNQDAASLPSRIPSASEPHAPAEVTMPRVIAGSMRTAELPDELPPPDFPAPLTPGTPRAPLPPALDDGETRRLSQTPAFRIMDAMAAMDALDAPTAPVTAPRPISVPPMPDDAYDVEPPAFSLENFPSFDDQPPQRAEGPGHIDPPPVGDSAPEGAPPALSSSWDGRPSSPFTLEPPLPAPPSSPVPQQPKGAPPSIIARVEEAIARLPDRGEPNDEPTRRAPHAGAMMAVDVDISAESVPKKKLSRKEKKREKTQKKKMPLAEPKVIVAPDIRPAMRPPMRPVAPTPDTPAMASSEIVPTDDDAARGSGAPTVDAMPPRDPNGLDVYPTTPELRALGSNDNTGEQAPRALRNRDEKAASPSSAAHAPRDFGADTSRALGADASSSHASRDPGADADAASSSRASRDPGADASSARALPDPGADAAFSARSSRDPGADASSTPQSRAGDVPARDASGEPMLAPPHTLQPPSDEQTGRLTSKQEHATLEAMPPLAMPPLTMPSMEASSALTRALAALDSDDADECTAAAVQLAAEAPADARGFRLAARALTLTAATGQMPKDAVDLFVAHAPKHGDRAATMAFEIQQKVPAGTRRAYTHLWLAGARAAGQDTSRVLDLLRDIAVVDAPSGPAFELAERVLIEVNDGSARDALYQAALKVAADDGARADLTKRRIGLLDNQQRFADALPLHAQLAADLASADLGARQAARRSFAQHGTPDDRARFLARLSRKLPGDEGIDVVQELLDVRLSVDDRIGAEAAAKDLLQRRPGDARGTKVLADLLADEPHRIDELVDVLRVGSQQALSWFGKTGEARALLERLAEVQEKAGRPEEAADAWVQVARLVPEERHVERALAALDEVKRHKEAVALLEETANAIAEPSFRARTLLRAADVAKTKLQKRGKARELVERALDVAPRDRQGLRMYADLLVEIGDAAAAISALERLATEEPMSGKDGARDRSAIQLRIGKLVEEHLLKPNDALKRYRAAAEMDAQNKDAWSALRAIARQRGDRALLVESLRGLAGAEPDLKERAALWRQIAKVERDERSDPAAAERAFIEALGLDAADVESLMGLAALAAARLQTDADLDAALAQPNDALLEVLRPQLVKVPASSTTTLPLALRRLTAIALSRAGERGLATQRFDEILQETPEELSTLMALARHLAAAPRGEEGAELRRLRCLETILLHHAFALKPPVQVDVWGDVTALRAATGDGAGARKAAKKVMALASTDELRACLSDRAVRAVALALDDARDAERDGKSIIQALKLDSERSVVESEKGRLLERAAGIAADELKDRVMARALLEDAVRANPSSPSAREALLDLDVASGDVAGALKQVRDMLATEREPSKKAALHLRLFRLRRKAGLDLEGAAAELKSAVELDPSNSEILDAAEVFFTEKNDSDGLDRLWSAQLRALDRGDVRARLKLLERLAQLRRYERRDLAGAIEALEAMTALDPEALKPREDAARLYTDLGLSKEAVGAWRGVLDRDPLAVEAWRGIFLRFAATRQGDEAFAVASTMTALDLAEEDVARAVRTIRPPFPRWPIPPKDPQLFRRKSAHPLERTPIRAVLEVAAPRLLPLYARRLRDFGFQRKDALADKHIPTSVLLAVRTLAQLLGLPEAPPLFQAEMGSTEGQSPPFAVLPSTEPGIIVTADVIKGGMTPERAFALGRAAAWLQPHAVMAAAVDAPTLRMILEGLTAAFLGAKNLERPDLEAEKVGKELAHALTSGMSSSDETALKADLLPALRDYVHARQQVQVADWRAGVGYTGDRVGFLMSTDLNAAFRVIKTTAGSAQSIGARLAIKELVLFSASSGYLGLRKDVGLALPELAAGPLLDLG